jgi:hypothetical protein
MIVLRALHLPETQELLTVYALGHHDRLEFFKQFLDAYNQEPSARTACLSEVEWSHLQDQTPITRIIL